MPIPAIVTLPITPRKSPKLGIMFIPFIMDILGKRIGVKRVLSLNVTGSKLLGQDVEEAARGYINTNSWLGIIPDYIWRDDQMENIYWINVFFRKLQASGHIFKDSRTVLHCECGAVEMLATAESISIRRRLYEYVAGIMHCKICKSPVAKDVQIVYLFRVPRFRPSHNSIIPDFTLREISNLAKKFAGVELLISRSRPSAISLWTGEDHVFLDVDFGWQLCLPIIRRYGYDPIVLIGSQENLLGCYLIQLLQHIIDRKSSVLIVPGYCKTKRSRDETLLSTFQEWPHNATRLYLAAHVTFKRKEMSMDVSLINLVRRVAIKIGQTRPQISQLSLHDALAVFEGIAIRQLLLKAQRTNTIPELLTELLI
jgi:hypothetical protein